MVKYTYDFNGVRTSKTLKSGSKGAFAVNYIYDGNNLVAEQRGNKLITYFYGVDGVAGFEYEENTYIYRKNVQGDITHIYKKLADGSLELVAKYVYDAWGNHDVLDAEGKIVDRTASVIANINPFRYRGYYFDVETGLYYLQTRYYDPELGRFISSDSIEYLDPETLGGLNLYAYCNSNPIMAIDPTGHAWWHWLVAALVVVAVTAATVLTAGAFAVALGATAAVTTAVMVGAAVGGVAMGAISIASQVSANGIENINLGTVAQATFIGGAIGALIGACAGVSGVGAGASSLAVAGGGTVSSGGAVALAGTLGLLVWFAKDPFIDHLEKGMDERQREMFQREIEDWKTGEGRGGADNLPKKLLKQIAEEIKKLYKKLVD